MNTAQKSPKVSVVMSVYNGARYLREAVDSILGQAFSAFEFIIVNDGSTDSTRDIILSYDEPRIRLIDNRANLGLPISLNKGIQSARGEYIARQDADDISHPERLEKQSAFLDAHGSVGVLGCWWTYLDVDGDTFSSGEIPNDDGVIQENLIHRNVKFPHGSLMFRRKALTSVDGYDARFRFTQDLDLLLRMVKKGLMFGAVEAPVYGLRKRLEPNDFKRRWQDRYRALAYERFFADQEPELLDVPYEPQHADVNGARVDRAIQARYWYDIGMAALADRRIKQLLKALRKSFLTGDVQTSLRFVARLVSSARSSIFKNRKSRESKVSSLS